MGAHRLTERQIIGRFYQRLEAAQQASYVSQIGFPVTSDQDSEEYLWLGMSPAMRQWVGARQAKGLRTNPWIVRNVLYEATLEVDAPSLEFDKSGQVQVRIDELAGRTVQHWDKLLSDLMIAGETTACYDGQAFFDTDHVEGDNVTQQSNDLTYDISDNGTGGTATVPTPQTAAGMIMAGIGAILGFKDDQNEPMNGGARSFLVMAPINYMTAVLSATSNPVLANGETNTLVTQNAIQIVPYINPRLTWTTKLAVFRTDGVVKPFILQEQEPVRIGAVASGSEHEFMFRKHYYGVSAKRAAAYGFWQQACLVTAAA